MKKLLSMLLVLSVLLATFNTVVFAIGAMLGETFNIISIAIAFWRFKKAPQETK